MELLMQVWNSIDGILGWVALVVLVSGALVLADRALSVLGSRQDARASRRRVAPDKSRIYFD
jgi:hypothetical protein